MDDPEQLIDHDTAKQLIEKVRVARDIAMSHEAPVRADCSTVHPPRCWQDLQKFLSDQNGDLPYVQSKHEERTNLIIENVLKVPAATASQNRHHRLAEPPPHASAPAQQARPRRVRDPRGLPAHPRVPRVHPQIMAQFNDDLVAANPEEPKIFKFVVHCVLQQKTGAWVQSATCQYWDRSTDSHLTVIHETEHMQCIVTIYMVLT